MAKDLGTPARIQAFRAKADQDFRPGLIWDNARRQRRGLNDVMQTPIRQELVNILRFPGPLALGLGAVIGGLVLGYVAVIQVVLR